jgi:mRNA interferase MazF
MPQAKTKSAPDRADIVWIQHDPQAGREMKGMHPMLVISPKVFNERTGIVIGFPMTHAEFNSDSPFAIAIQGPKKEIGFVLCHQPKSFDWAQCLHRCYVKRLIVWMRFAVCAITDPMLNS